MKKFTVKFFAYFRDNRFNVKECEYPTGTTVGDIIAEYDIDMEEVGIMMINHRHCTAESEPQDNDQVAIFPHVGGG